MPRWRENTILISCPKVIILLSPLFHWEEFPFVQHRLAFQAKQGCQDRLQKQNIDITRYKLGKPGFARVPLAQVFQYMVFYLMAFSYADMTMWPVESLKKDLPLL